MAVSACSVQITVLVAALALLLAGSAGAESRLQPSAPAASAASATVASASRSVPGSAPAALLASIAEAARAAQTTCHPRIHHDTYAFEACLVELLNAEQRPSPRRLGIEYFGYVGAMNSERMGMEGASLTAYEFLRRFRVTQRKLHVDDAALCSTVPGDCEVRLARMKAMQAAPEFRHPAPRDRSTELQHVH